MPPWMMESDNSLREAARQATLNLVQVLQKNEERVRALRKAGLNSSSTRTTEELSRAVNEGLPPEMHLRAIKVGRPGPISLSLKPNQG